MLRQLSWEPAQSQTRPRSGSGTAGLESLGRGNETNSSESAQNQTRSRSGSGSVGGWNIWDEEMKTDRVSLLTFTGSLARVLGLPPALLISPIV